MMNWMSLICLFLGSFSMAYLLLLHFFEKIKVKRRLEGVSLKPVIQSNSYKYFKALVLPLGQTMLRITPKNLKHRVEATLKMSGVTWELSEVLLLEVVLSIIGGILGIVLAWLTGKNHLAVVFMALMAMMGVMLPNMIFFIKTKKRKKLIYERLPSFLDYLIITVEAGLGLDLAITKVVSKMQGPLAEILAQALTEMKYGKSRTEALKNMSAQADIPELTSLVNAIISGEKFGIGIGNILKIQGQQLREKRKQRIQEEAYKIPVKLVFPLVLFILPGLFIVLIGPAAIQMMQSLF